MLAEIEAASNRRFLPGLLLAFIDFLKELEAAGARYRSLDAFFKAHPRKTTTSGGRPANTLIVERQIIDAHGKRKIGTISIRPSYNKAERWIYGNKRFDYPSMAPHATQAWNDYMHWLESLLLFSDRDLDELESAVKAYVLEKYPAHEIDPSTIVREPPRFYLFIRDFKMEKQGPEEKTGAVYQGTVFGYVRADAPHLQVDVDRVRTGSRRVGRIGDIDAREGGALIVTAEVKQFVLGADDADDLAVFASDVAKHKALGLVVALDFEDGVRDQLRKMGLEPVSRSDLVSMVRMWDPLKQRIAVQALIYFVQYKEKNSALLARINEFFESIADEMSPQSGTDEKSKRKRKGSR